LTADSRGSTPTSILTGIGRPSLLASTIATLFEDRIHDSRCPQRRFAGARTPALAVQLVHDRLDQRLMNVRWIPNVDFLDTAPAREPNRDR
jgi:hypothetical protein